MIFSVAAADVLVAAAASPAPAAQNAGARDRDRAASDLQQRVGNELHRTPSHRTYMSSVPFEDGRDSVSQALRQALDCISLGILILDSELSVCFSNAPARRLLGIAADEPSVRVIVYLRGVQDRIRCARRCGGDDADTPQDVAAKGGNAAAGRAGPAAGCRPDELDRLPWRRSIHPAPCKNEGAGVPAFAPLGADPGRDEERAVPKLPNRNRERMASGR